MKNNEEILKKAATRADEWLKEFRPLGERNTEKVLKELSKRTFNGKKIKAYVAESPAEAEKLIKEICKGDKEVMKNAYRCIWDYYLMAFYDCAYITCCSEQDHEFGKQSFFEAFKAGLGFYINLGEVGIGVMMPQAHRDLENRIHNQNGPAIVWGDEETYWYKGVQVPKEWILHPEDQDPKEALTHKNIEQRRALCELIGWNTVLEHLNKKVIDKDPDPEIGELFEVDLPDAPKCRFLRVLCATGRFFCLQVPPEMNTALEANSWTYGIDKEEYVPEVRT